MADRSRLGKTALVGWRKPIGERVAGPVSERTPLSREQVESLVGATFFALSVYYVVSTVARALKER